MLWSRVQSAVRNAFGSLCGHSSSKRAQLQRPLNPQLQHSCSASSSMSRWPSDQPMLAPDHCSSSQIAPVLSRISSYEPVHTADELLNAGSIDNSIEVVGCSPETPGTPKLQQQQQQQQPKQSGSNQQQLHTLQADPDPAAATAACAAAGTCTLEEVWKQLQKQKPAGFSTASSSRMRNHRSGLYASTASSRRISLQAPGTRAANRCVTFCVS
jgi:hypothetical protein